MSYEDYSPAYQYGWESYARRGTDGRSFDSVENDLHTGWEKVKGNSRLAWDQAKHASREAWNRVRNGVHTPAKATSTI